MTELTRRSGCTLIATLPAGAVVVRMADSKDRIVDPSRICIVAEPDSPPRWLTVPKPDLKPVFVTIEVVDD